MKVTIRLLLTTAFLALVVISSHAQKKPATYTDFDRGHYYFYYKKWDSAYLALNRYIANPTDTLLKGRAYNIMGEMQWKTGDLHGAEQSLANAMKTLDPKNPNHQEEISISYNLLGNLYLDQKQYNEAIDTYDKAKDLFTNSDYVFEILNGKATALQKRGTYDSAVVIYDSVLRLKPANRLLLARIIDNRAHTKWLQNHGYPALPEYRAALKIRTDSQQIQGLNASYAHLSDFYAATRLDSALWYAQKMRELAISSQNPDDIIEALDKMIRLTKAPHLKEEWYEAYKTISDSIRLSRDTTSNRFAMIRYEVQKNKANTLLLQQHISRQRFLLFGLIALAIMVIAGLWLWYDKRRKRIKQEAENAIRNARLKTSQKVHDVVANGLYGIMNELEHRTSIEREPLINKIEDLYEKSRNISYEEIPSAIAVDYNNQVHNLLNAYSTEETRVIIVGNQPEFWNRITGAQKNELELILQELMINMQKHSQAKNVSVVFRQENNRGFITYKDDGRGFPAGLKFGNGLNNTVSRINSLNGEVNFGKTGKEGLSVAVSFPLESVNI